MTISWEDPSSTFRRILLNLQCARNARTLEIRAIFSSITLSPDRINASVTEGQLRTFAPLPRSATTNAASSMVTPLHASKMCNEITREVYRHLRAEAACFRLTRHLRPNSSAGGHGCGQFSIRNIIGEPITIFAPASRPAISSTLRRG